MIPMLLEKGGISIHALREEGDAGGDVKTLWKWRFLSTPSARRATCVSVPSVVALHDISIHALREEGDPHELCDG